MLHSRCKLEPIGILLIGLLLTPYPLEASIKDVTVVGNHSCSTKEIRAIANSVDCSFLDSSCVDLICKRLLDYYVGLGFLDAVVRCESQIDSSLIITIDEGSQSTLSFVVIQGASIADSSRLQAFFERCYGKPIDPRCVDRCIESVLRYYDASGYPLARVSPGGTLREGNHIGLRFDIDVGPKAKMKKVTFSGLRNTRAGVLVKKIGFVPGKDYDGRKVDAWQNKLTTTGVFESVSTPELTFDLSDTSITVNFNVSERRTTRIEGMGAYTPLGRTKTFVGSLNFDMLNIAGTLRRCSVEWSRAAPGRLRWNIRYTEPMLLLSDLSAELSLGSEVEDTSYAYRRLQTLISWQTEAQIEVGSGVTLASTKDRTSSYSEGDFSEKGMVFTLKLVSGDMLVEQKGRFYGNLRAALGRISYSGRKPNKTITEADVSLVYGRRIGSLFIFSVELSYKRVYASDGIVPAPKKIRVGGSSSIRGYAEESFSVDRLIRFSIEPGLALGEFSRIYAFLDLAVLEGSGYSLDDLNSQPLGYGFGLVAGSDAGAVRIDIGVGRKGGWDEARLHFSLLGSF